MSWDQFCLVGHRGASEVAPENTMAGFIAARDLGADAIEFDIHQSSDGELVVIHDFNIDRTTNGTGLVFEQTWAELSKLDAGSWFDPSFIGERIPRLEDVLRLTDLNFELEIKGFEPDILDNVLVVVDQADVFERVKFTGWNLSLLAELNQRRPEARIGLFSRKKEPWMTDAIFEHIVTGMARFAKADIAHVYAGGLSKPIVDRLHAMGKAVQANDATSAEEVNAAITMGTDHVSANDVAMAVAIRNKLIP